jgi:AAA15 family ATPase/GTPase
MLKHFEHIKIENFKKFKSLELNGISTFNLITGENNVGKTCLLEALLVNDNNQNVIRAYHKTLCFRNIHIHLSNIGDQVTTPDENYFKYLKKNIDTPIKISYSFKGYQNQLVEIEDKLYNNLSENDKKANNILNSTDFNDLSKLPEKWVKVTRNEKVEYLEPMFADDYTFLHEKLYIPFIKATDFYDRDFLSLIQPFLSNIILRQELVNDLTILISDLKDIGVNKIDDKWHVCFATEKNPDFLPVTMWGDGTLRFLRYLIELKKCENGFLLIDEFDIGIHHSKLNSIFKKIFFLAKKYNVQLFLTTHSDEFTKNYLKVISELEIQHSESDFSFFILNENLETKESSASNYNFENFKSLVDLEYNYRGGSGYDN